MAIVAQLLNARFRVGNEILARAESQTAGRTNLDAGRLEPNGGAVRAEGALEDLLSLGKLPRHIERTTGNAVSTAEPGAR